VHLDALVDWLVCREVCIPGKAHLGLNLTVDPKAAPAGPPVGALGHALTTLPQPLPPTMKLTVNGGKQDFVLTLITGDKETEGEFYPFDQEQVANAAEQISEPVPGGLRLRVRRAPELTALPKQLHGLIKLSGEQAYDITADVVPGEVAAETGSGAVGSRAAEASRVTGLSAIGLAFVGGIILNLMPCVFPVLFLKGLGLVQSSSGERAKVRLHGLVYTLGILVSFWVIVAVLLLLRAGGSQAGWGFQLQSPTFLAVLALGIFFFSLSLAGQFELGLSLTSAGGSLAEKQGYTGSFFTGVLATVVATPCTAPLMGAAVGFALAQPAWMSFAVFTALGLGLALPYLLLSAQPAWTRWLPKPGAWMEILKQLTAVPLFATVIWLTWVYGRLFAAGGDAGVAMDRVSRLLAGFLLLAIAGWVLGRWPARRWGTLAALALGVLAVAAPLYVPTDKTLAWEPFSEGAIQQARASGRSVFVDYTAAWCLSCQVNERLVLRSAEVQAEFRSRHVTLMKADWTKYDAAITASLASVGRSGVPTYVIYPAGSESKADVLPELLSRNVVLTALKKDAR
jgi:thiol:disulfide interchange protein DsbD